MQYISGVETHLKLQWHVLRSKPNKEMILWRELTTRGFESYYPHLRVQPVDPRSRKVRPYFPGYLFIHTDVAELGASTFQWIPFSAGLLAFDGVAAAVPDHLLHAIRRHVEEINSEGLRARQLTDLQPGDPVRVQSGPFEGHRAIFDAHLPGQERVRVLLKLLASGHVNVVLPADQVQRLRKKGR